MAYRTVKEIYRRDPSLRYKDVKTVLPLHFQEEYPNLVSFLETYYDIEPSISETWFDLRDLDDTTLQNLDRLYYEIANGAATTDFSDPRFVAKLIHQIIENKGNEYSAQLFFRLFYNEIPEISYPKDNLFIVAESPLNNQFHLIQDGARYQILSVLIRSGKTISEWEALYRKFVHTAGYYLSAEVFLEGVGTVSPTAPIALLDSAAGDLVISDIGEIGVTSQGEIAFLVDSANEVFILSDDINLDKYDDVSIEILEKQYDNIFDIDKAASPRFSEDSDGTFKSPYFSNTLETWDKGYRRDSAYPLWKDSDGSSNT